MSDVKVSIADGVATVVLDRPPVNAVTQETFREIRAAFEALNDQRDVRVAVLTATGTRAFVGGADLKAFDEDRSAATSPLRIVDPGRAAREAFQSIYYCAVPVIAAVNGPAIGAGLALAAVCDVILATEDAYFSTPEINVGLLGASAQLMLLVGRHRTRELFLTGERISAQELHRLGAVRSVLPHGELMARANELAASIAKRSPIAIRLAKDSMNRTEFASIWEAYRIEQDYTARMTAFDDSLEARRAFLEHRDPVWRWR